MVLLIFPSKKSLVKKHWQPATSLWLFKMLMTIFLDFYNFIQIFADSSKSHEKKRKKLMKKKIIKDQ